MPCEYRLMHHASSSHMFLHTMLQQKTVTRSFTAEDHTIYNTHVVRGYTLAKSIVQREPAQRDSLQGTLLEQIISRRH
jgi:hypothetical protein